VETTRQKRRRAIVKPNSQQLSLFAARAALPSRPLSLDPSPDEIRICAGCGKQIIVQRRTAEGEVVSDFISAAGECFHCAYPER
jgi:hypothetical protein